MAPVSSGFGKATVGKAPSGFCCSGTLSTSVKPRLGERAAHERVAHPVERRVDDAQAAVALAGVHGERAHRVEVRALGIGRRVGDEALALAAPRSGGRATTRAERGPLDGAAMRASTGGTICAAFSQYTL